MPDICQEDPTVPPPGKRSGAGMGSIFPFLKRSLATNPQVPPQPEDETTVPQPDPPLPRETRKREAP
jgi:hypothetical protein